MAQAQISISVPGESIKTVKVRVREDQVKFEKPQDILIIIWKYPTIQAISGRRVPEPYAVQMEMPWGDIRTLSQHKSKPKAEKELRKIQRRLNSGRGKIIIGKEFSVKTSYPEEISIKTS